MAKYTREQLLAAANQRGMSVGSDEDKIPREELLAAARSRGIPIQEPSLSEQVGKGAAAFGLGAAQGAAKVGQGLGEVVTGGVNILSRYLGHPYFGPPLNLQAPAPDVFYGPAAKLRGTRAARVGEVAGQIGGDIALGGGLAGLVKRAALKGLAAESLGFGAAGALGTPGGIKERGTAAAIGAVAPGAANLAGKGVRLSAQGFRALKPKQWSLKALGKHVKDTAQANKDIGKGMYDEVFEGTQNIKPKISAKTVGILGKAEKLAQSDIDIEKAFITYGQKEPVEGLHYLQSDFAKAERKLIKKKESIHGLTSSENAKLKLLTEAKGYIKKDLQTNLSKANYKKYLKVQDFWSENVAIFDKASSLRKLLGQDKLLTEKLVTDLSEEGINAEKLRNILGLQLFGLGGKGVKKAARAAATGIAAGAGLKGFSEIFG